ncbi:MAG: endonuclease III [Clostridia bacterium]|nr:endonuclease III [Clostridia bacterium]MDE7078602.1 endonuclease III [Clostridia bacterium]
MAKKFNKREVSDMIAKLEVMHPNAECELAYSSPFELLVAVILSAQCTDKRVNQVTEKLFKVYNTPLQFAELSEDELIKYIYTCGFYRNKAKNIISASQDIVTKFGGEVPGDIDSLMTLAGVGRKTANVVYSVAFGGQAIAVDTHVLRLSNRIGFCDSNDPIMVERALMNVLPKEVWAHAHHLLIHHGRYTCSARKPQCSECLINEYCRHFNGK